MLNAVRWLVALASGDVRGAKVHVHVETATPADKELLRELAYLIYPARIHDLHGASANVVEPYDAVCDAYSACTLCGRPISGGARRAALHDLVKEVARDERLDAPCLAARLFGRAANKPVFIFTVGTGEPPAFLRCQSPVSISLDKVKAEFCRGEHTAAILKYCDVAYAAVVGVEKGRKSFEKYAEEVGKALNGEGDLMALASLREEFFKDVLEEAGIGPLRPVYQPPDLSGVGYVPQLSGVNARGKLKEIHTENLAIISGNNVVYVIRIDGDKFGAFVRQANISEDVLSQFKSAISALIETARGVYPAVIYAGGDENMTVASARSFRDVAQMLTALRRLYISFGRRWGHNLTISAGVIASRYKTPMYHAAMLADKAVEEAKSTGGDAVALLYAKGLTSEEFGIVKFPHLGHALAAAAKYAEERPDMGTCTQQLYASLFRGAPPPAPGLEKTLMFITNAASLI